MVCQLCSPIPVSMYCSILCNCVKVFCVPDLRYFVYLFQGVLQMVCQLCSPIPVSRYCSMLCNCFKGFCVPVLRCITDGVWVYKGIVRMVCNCVKLL